MLTGPTIITEQETRIDSMIFRLLIRPEMQRPWSVDELARYVNADPSKSLDRLYANGLIHRLEGYVWATQAAVMSDYV